MRHKLRLLNLVLIVVFIFSFTGCLTYKLPNSLADKAATETITSAETTRSGTTTPETTAQPVQENGEYGIGDTGPAGGIIFYINPNYAIDGWKYLEAAPSDFPGDKNDCRIQWDNGNYVETGATATAIGTGMSNTQKIVDILGNGSYAAKLCSDLTLGGYSDWFLPSRDELNLLYENLHLKGLGSFEPDYYWSSSESGASGAWSQHFGNGSQSSFSKVEYGENGNVEDYDGKNYYRRVRAVRAFN
jgi:hypothetical protein